MFYDKKIKYLDVYEREEKVQNAGFVRLEARGSKASVQIRVEKLRPTDTAAVQVVLTGGGKEAVLGEMQLEKGRGMLECRELACADLAGTIAYEELQEIRLKLPGERLLRCVVREQEVVPEQVAESQPAPEAGLEAAMISDDEVMPPPVQMPEQAVESEQMPENLSQLEDMERPMSRPETIIPAEPIPQPRSMSEPGPILRPIPTQPEHSQPARSRTTTKWQQLSSIYPHIRPFGDGRDYLQLKPEDLVVLTQKYYPLASNSFLLHGYYNYEHLILSREMRKDGERFYIGVPGNFYEKEKQVAVLFGFESFEGKEEPAKSGDFGYYMISVEI